MVKNPPASAEHARGRIPSPGSGRSLEQAMATPSGIPAWEIPWTEEPGGLQSVGKQESDITEQLNNNSNIRGLHTLEGQSNEKCVCDKVCLPVCPSLATASTPQPVFYSVPQNLAQKSKKNPGKLNTVKV